MISLKQSVKQILINKQHKIYDKRLSEKRMCYNDWIVSQEEKLQIANIIVKEKKNCLTNETKKNGNGGDKNENEGFRSENASPIHLFEVWDQKAQDEKKSKFLVLSLRGMEDKKSFDTAEIRKNKEADVIVFLLSEGRIADIALPLIYREFRKNENQMLIYGDEDVNTDHGREKPWFKPDWSPDTFLSYFYFGSLVAVRAEALRKAMKMHDAAEIYTMCYQIIRTAGDECFAYNGRKAVGHISEVLFHGSREGYEEIKNLRLPEEIAATIKEERMPGAPTVHVGSVSAEPFISIVIPSKDNPSVLLHCIHSLVERSKIEYPYEILIIDNGSCEENRRAIAGETERLNQESGGGKAFLGIRYHYEPMKFNFSKMCNRGAALSKGELFLFLNDDMEIIQDNWLSLLTEKALFPHVGAVGAKLLYPDSAIIQHAGITNLRVGPAHKLQFLSDEQVLYYGKNRLAHDVMGVTGACLLLRREIFEQAGGFSEELAVAFNDVDLCYTIYEMGYYNVVRNDVVLYHHESLSRGKDGESEEKQQRLLREKDVLYERHQSLYGKDPFYHKYLTTDMLESNYSPAFHYQVTLDMMWADVTGMQELPANVSEDPCVVIGMECAMDIYKWKYGVEPGKGEVKPTDQDMGYYFQGYSFIIGADNACYKKTLLLQNKENTRVLKIPIDERYRPDIRNNLRDQLNVDLTGFAAKVRLDSVPKGNYRFGMLVEDRCSRQKLVGYSNWILQAGDESGQVKEEKIIGKAGSDNGLQGSL